jgi:hypothetical protein
MNMELFGGSVERYGRAPSGKRSVCHNAPAIALDSFQNPVSK